MPHVFWRAKAREDVRRIIDYISARNPAAAIRHAELFEHAVERLAEHPHMHRSGRIQGTREAVITPNYILIYQVGTEAIEILAVVHTHQQYP